MNEEVRELQGKVASLEIRMAITESNVQKVTEDITSIKDDTKWLRRALTNAGIGILVTVSAGIMVAVILFVMKGGTIS